MNYSRRFFRFASLFLILLIASQPFASTTASSFPHNDLNETPVVTRAKPNTALLGGGEWTPLGGPVISGGEVTAMVVDPANPGTIYATIAFAPGGGSTLYRSIDRGVTWNWVFETSVKANTLAVYGSNIYIGAAQEWLPMPAIFSSTDGGVTWNEPFQLERGLGITSISLDQAHSNIAIAAGNGFPFDAGFRGLVFGTQNGGQDWEPLLANPSNGCASVLISPHNSSWMFASCVDALYRSIDNGDTWNDIGFYDASFNALIAHPSDPTTFFGTNGNYVYRSQDGGMTWQAVFSGGNHWMGLLGMQAPSTVYFVSANSVWMNPMDGDGGAWTQLPDLFQSAYSFAIDSSDSPTVLLAGLVNAGVIASTDGGLSWQEHNTNITSLPRVNDIDVVEGSPDKIFAANGGYDFLQTENYGGFRSDDGGVSWTKVSLANITTFDVDPTNSQIVFAGAVACEAPTILMSTDGGVTFDGAYTPPWFLEDCAGGWQQINAIEIMPANPDTIFAVGKSSPSGEPSYGMVLRSQDGGLTWEEVYTQPDEFRRVEIPHSITGTVYVGGNDTTTGTTFGVLYRTLDNGDTWELVFYENQGQYSGIEDLAIDAVSPNILYLSCHQYHFYRSMDSGETWEYLGQVGAWSPGAIRLAADPIEGGHIYMTGPDYIGESFDGGNTWSNYDADLKNGSPLMWSAGAIVPGSGVPVQTLYAGFSGVWVHTRLRQGSGDRWVSPSGSDSTNNCTDSAYPCQTIGWALNFAKPDEIIRVAGGTYFENLNIFGSVTIEGGYSGEPDWVRDLDMYESILDGSLNPAIPGAWDNALIGQPNVIWDQDAGLYRMFYAGAGGIYNNSFGVATSPNGITWTRYADNPIMTPDASTWEGSLIEDPCVRYENSVFKMWYGNTNSIGYATSLDGIHWTKHPEPVFGPNPNPLAWDANIIRGSSVIKVGDQYIMAYAGASTTSSLQIGIAASPDGITWTRHGDPVLQPGNWGEWDEGRVLFPDLIYTGGVYHMLYTARPSSRIGLATSTDFIHWTKYAGNPILPGDDAWEYGTTWGASHLNIGGAWKLWYTASGDTPYQIGLATSTDGYNWERDTEHNPVFAPGTPSDSGGESLVTIASEGWPDVILDGLTLTNASGWYGGAVNLMNGSLSLQSVTVTDNHTFFECAGILTSYDTTLDILTSEIINNISDINRGGGLCNQGITTINRSTIAGNKAWSGSGISNYGTFSILNSTLTGNIAESQAGAIYNESGSTLDMINVTITGNNAPITGGVVNMGGTARAWNLILVDNAGGECEGVWSGGSNNLSDDTSCGNLFEQVSLAELKLGELSGSPAYYPLQPGSAAIDAGTTSFCLDIDQPGNPRPQDGDGDGLSICDIGAFEAPLFVWHQVFLPAIMK